MKFGDDTPGGRRLSFRAYVVASLALHAALGGALYWFGGYQVELRRQDTQVAASVQATYRARNTRRVEDLQKIQALLEQSARPEPEQDALPAAPQPVPDAPAEQLAQARALSKTIEEVSRDIKAEELARLTGMRKEEARAEIDANMAAPAPAPSQAIKPDDEIAALEARARELLAQRAQDLHRQQQGVEVGSAEAAGDPEGQDRGNEGPRPGGQPGQKGAAGADARAQASRNIDDFLDQGVDPARAPRQRSKVGRLINFGNGQIPHVSTDQLIRGQGRMLGAGGQYANRIHLDSWYLIGPFPGRSDRGTAATPVFPPEQAVLLDAVYRGKDRRLLKWEYVSGMAYPLIPREPVEDAVYYGYTEVLMDRERDLMVWLGVDDDATVYLNDRIMWKSDDTNKGWFFTSVYRDRQGYDRSFNRTERVMLVHFKKGRNKIFLKLWNDTNEMFFSMVLTLPR
jgi:hypothetical protein